MLELSISGDIPVEVVDGPDALVDDLRPAGSARAARASRPYSSTAAKGDVR